MERPTKERREESVHGPARDWPMGRCVRWGLYIGGVYAMLAVLASQKLPSFEDRYGFTVLETILMDLGGGFAGGALVGLLIPRVRNAWGYVATAQASLLPAYLLFAISWPKGAGVEAIDGVGAALAVGGFVGLALWRVRSDK